MITFTRDRQVKRNGMRVGWIEDRGDDLCRLRWRLRFTSTSGIPGVHGNYRLLRCAKDAAICVLETMPDAEA